MGVRVSWCFCATCLVPEMVRVGKDTCLELGQGRDSSMPGAGPSGDGETLQHARHALKMEKFIVTGRDGNGPQGGTEMGRAPPSAMSVHLSQLEHIPTLQVVE